MKSGPKGSPTPAPLPDGHFYSPIVDADEASARQEAIWPPNPTVRGIDFNDANHIRILTEWFPRFIGDYDYPETQDPAANPAGFFTRNSQFSWLDARLLFVMLRALKPRRLVEVGSGFSSLLSADVNVRWLARGCDITCIEPYPRPFLKAGVPGIARVIERKVQDLPVDALASLEAGDILFIDSSHVSKTGSDVNYLYFEVLPILKPGVLVHVHDIFLPHDYPKDWVLGERRSWNEQYVLRALLMFSRRFRVFFGSSHAFHKHGALTAKALALPGGAAFGGGSFWIETCG